MTWLRRLARLILPGRGRHRGQSARRARREQAAQHEQWIRDLLPPTRRSVARCEQCGSRDRQQICGQLLCACCGAVPVSEWPPRIARWVRVAFPVGDDTILLPPIRAQMVLDLMANGFAWDVQ